MAIDDLNGPKEVLLEADRRGQDLSGLKSGLLVPGVIKLKIWINGRQLLFIIHILDVDQLALIRYVACKAIRRDRYPDVADLISCFYKYIW